MDGLRLSFCNQNVKRCFLSNKLRPSGFISSFIRAIFYRFFCQSNVRAKSQQVVGRDQLDKNTWSVLAPQTVQRENKLAGRIRDGLRLSVSQGCLLPGTVPTDISHNIISIIYIFMNSKLPKLRCSDVH